MVARNCAGDGLGALRCHYAGSMGDLIETGMAENGGEHDALDLLEYAPYLFRSIANRLGQADSSYLTQNFGVGLNEWSCIALLALEPNIPATRICDVSGFDKGVISRSINSLETKGLVRGALAPNRSRLRLINLTPDGWQLYHETRAYARQREERLLAGLSKAERGNLTRMLNVVHANMRKSEGS